MGSCSIRADRDQMSELTKGVRRRTVLFLVAVDYHFRPSSNCDIRGLDQSLLLARAIQAETFGSCSV